MKRKLLYCAALLILQILVACGGGGGSSSQAPAIKSYTLDFTPSGNGTLSGATSQTVSQGANASAVTALPSAGYHFINWTESGTVVETTAVTTIVNVGNNHSYTANFAPNVTAKTSATLTINLTGTLPSATAIAGAAFTLTLPADVTPATTGGIVNDGVVTLTGTFAGSTLSPQVLYTAATPGVPGTLQITLASSVPIGITQAGEAATITLHLANGAAPTTSSFAVTAASVIDVALYGPISAMAAGVAGVILSD